MGCCQSPAQQGYQTPKKKPLQKVNQQKIIQQNKNNKQVQKQKQKVKLDKLKQNNQKTLIIQQPSKTQTQQSKNKKVNEQKVVQIQQQKAVKLVIDQNDLKLEINKDQQKVKRVQEPSRIYIDLSSKIEPKNQKDVRQSDIPDLQMVTARKFIQQKIQQEHLQYDQSKYQICSQNYFDGKKFQLNMKEANNFFVFVNPENFSTIKKLSAQQQLQIPVDILQKP